MLKKISEKLIKIISRNFGWKVFSVVCAIVLWFIVMNIINPTEMQTYSVNITFVNQDKLAEKGFVVMNKEEIENTKVEIKVKSTRTALDELGKNRKEIKATVDLKQFAMLYADDVKEPFKVAVNPSIPTSYVYTYELVNFTPGEISVQLDNIVETEKEVIVDSEGEVANGYLAGDSSVNPSFVKIKGASSEVESVGSVKVFADLNDASEKIVQDLKPVVYDKDGNEMDSLIVEPATVQVSLGVYKYGQIPVEEPVVEGNAAENFKISKIEWTPEYIEVIGNEDEISKIGSIKPTVKLEGQSDEKIVKTYDVNAHIAKNKLSIKPGTKKEITVTLTLVREEEKEVVINNSNIKIEGGNDENEIRFLDEIRMKLKGSKDELDKIDGDNIIAVMDVGGLGVGRNSVRIVPDLPEGVSLSQEAEAQIEIVKKDDFQNSGNNENDEENSEENNTENELTSFY